MGQPPIQTSNDMTGQAVDAVFVGGGGLLVKSPDTKIIKGTYRRQSVTHYYNARTGINIMKNDRGEFISGWKLDEDQIANILTRGSL